MAGQQTRPLKILTLDGGGLQALATLSSLNAVCRAVADQNGADRPPAPHELFDIICGVGTGGWIALLLGRYRLDIGTCTAIYMELATKVDVEIRSSSPSKWNRNFKLDQNQLLKVVEEVLERYDLDPALLCEPRSEPEREEQSRCKYAFAVGVIPGENKQPAKYELLRSYRRPVETAGALLPGPKPESCQMPEVFAATGAAKFFLQPFKIGGTTFFDETFPQSHPLSLIALNEAIGLYGRDLQISVLLNIGPGIPADKDCKELDSMSLGPIGRLARKFSWPASLRTSFGEKSPHGRVGRERLVRNISKGLSPSATALELESKRKGLIKDRLREMYGARGVERYHHLGPEYSPERASLNDVHALCRPRSGTNRQKEQIRSQAQGMVRAGWVDVVS